MIFLFSDEDEVISLLKKKKEVDPVFVLALLWKYNSLECKGMNKEDKLQSIIKILNLILVCYPVDLMIHGKAFLNKWK